MLDHVDLPELLDNNVLGDEDSHGLENIEEDEQQEVVMEAETCVEVIVWRLQRLSVPSLVFSGVTVSVNERPGHRS